MRTRIQEKFPARPRLLVPYHLASASPCFPLPRQVREDEQGTGAAARQAPARVSQWRDAMGDRRQGGSRCGSGRAAWAAACMDAARRDSFYLCTASRSHSSSPPPQPRSPAGGGGRRRQCPWLRPSRLPPPCSSGCARAAEPRR
jgi:hypothetical protein